MIDWEFGLKLKEGSFSATWILILTWAVIVIGLSVIVLLFRTKRVIQVLMKSELSITMKQGLDEKVNTSWDTYPPRQSLGYPGYLSLGAPNSQSAPKKKVHP